MIERKAIACGASGKAGGAFLFLFFFIFTCLKSTEYRLQAFWRVIGALVNPHKSSLSTALRRLRSVQVFFFCLFLVCLQKNMP